MLAARGGSFARRLAPAWAARRGMAMSAKAAPSADNPDLNWSLCMHEVAPNGMTHRNLDVASLVQRCQGTLTPSKAVKVASSEPVAVRNLVHVDPKAPAATLEMVQNSVSTNKIDGRFGSMPPIRYRKLFDAMAGALRDADELFVHDSVCGGIRLRLITDDAPTALFMHHLSSTTVVDDDDVFKHASKASVIFHSSAVDIPSTGIKLAAKEFTIFDPCYNTLLVGGTTNKEAIMHGIETLVASKIQQYAAVTPDMAVEPVVLHCDTLTGAGATTAVFGAGALMPPGPGLSGPHASVFGGVDTILPLFSGASSTHAKAVEATKAGDLVETVAAASGSFTRATCSLAETAKPSPLSSVVLVVNDATKTLPLLSKLSAAQASHFFYGGPSAPSSMPCFSPVPTNASKVTEQFSALTKSCDVYLVNPASGNAAACIEAIAKGNGAKAKFTNSKQTGLSTCTTLPGLQNASLRHSTTAAAVKKLGAERLDAMLAVHGVVPDMVVKGGLSA